MLLHELTFDNYTLFAHISQVNTQSHLVFGFLGNIFHSC